MEADAILKNILDMDILPGTVRPSHDLSLLFAGAGGRPRRTRGQRAFAMTHVDTMYTTTAKRNFPWNVRTRES